MIGSNKGTLNRAFVKLVKVHYFIPDALTIVFRNDEDTPTHWQLVAYVIANEREHIVSS